MTKHHLARTVATGIAVAALALPIGWAIGPASADPPATTAGTARPTQPTAEPGPARAERRAERRAARQERLAERLGITTDELHDARLDVLRDELDERVAAGKITQQLADRIVAAAEDGTLPQMRAELRAERAARR